MPASPDTLATLLIQEDQATILAAALQLCQTLNLPVDSWQAGDPTRALFTFEAQYLSNLDALITGYIQSGTLDNAAQAATTQWLIILAKQQFNVDVPTATYATTQVTLTNTGGGIYDLAAGDVVVKCSTTGSTYTSTTGGVLAGSGGTLSITVVADVAGSASSAGATEIDTLVTTFLGVTCSNPIAAIGTDVPAPAAIVQMCRDKTASFSPNGPADAYRYVALNSALTSTLNPTRARVYADSDTGDVTVYIAGEAGALGSPDVAAVQAAIQQWCTPLCITPTVQSANPVTVFVTYTVYVYTSVNQSAAQIEAAIQTALENLFETLSIGGDITPPATTGFLYQSLIEATIGTVFPGKTFNVVISLPSGDTALGNGDVPALGTITPTVVLVPGP